LLPTVVRLAFLRTAEAEIEGGGKHHINPRPVYALKGNYDCEWRKC
jgi:hypothetical protein